MMNKILALMVCTIALVSCLGGSEYSDSYTSYASFEYSDDYVKMFGEDSLCVETTYKVGFTWGSYLAFSHKLGENDAFEGGFLLSYLAVPESGNTELLENNRYRANQICTPPAKNTYMVFYKSTSMPEKHFWFNYLQGEIKGTCSPQFVRVNNSVEVIDALKNTFQKGDVMILKATGYLKDKSTGEAQIRLAEFSDPRDSIISTWTTFELSDLGQVDRVDFDFIMPSERQVPQVVCMDDFTAGLSFATK